MDHSRRPNHSPGQVERIIEDRILEHREAHSTWGARKIHQLLTRENLPLIPAISTITEILRRHGKLGITKSTAAFTRFERKVPNELWQIDFKGHFPTEQARCHPLTLLDDHSRFSLCLKACPDEKGPMVKTSLIQCFREYGLPIQINSDNGNPWGNAGQEEAWNRFAIWLMKIGIRLTYSRPYHPQTNGKLERFHRSLKQELLNQRNFKDFLETQEAFDAWRHTYNFYRPHEAIEMKTPSERYASSSRPYSETPLKIEYEDGVIRKVDLAGRTSFKGKRIRIGKSFSGEHVSIKETDQEDIYSIFFMHTMIKSLDLKDSSPSEVQV
jgi:transposase InsO family protein